MRLSTIQIIWRTFAKYRWHIVVLTVLGFVGALLDGIGINAVIPLVSFFMSDGQPTDLISRTVQSFFGFLGIPFTFRYLLAFILVLFMVRSVSSVVFSYVRGWISADFLTNKSEQMFQKTFAAGWPFFIKQKMGVIQNSLTRDIQTTSGLLEATGQVIQSFSGLLMYFVVAFSISPLLTVLTLLGGSMLFVVIRPLVRRIRNRTEAMAATEKNIAHFLSEHVLGMKAVKASAAEGAAVGRSKELLMYLRRLYIRLALMRSLSTSLFQPFSLLFVIILFSITYYQPNFSIISFAATIYLIQKMFTYLESGQNALNSVISSVPYAASLEQFEQLLDSHKEVPTPGTTPFAFEKSLEFKHVSLSYADRTPALEDVQFTIRRGETLALIGPSGAGKTTVADLFLRLLEPTSGDILLDGVPLCSIPMNEWRMRVGYVAQDVFLLNDTIEENIRFYVPSVTAADIQHAAMQANIHEFIMSLKDGYNTVVGDRGVLLSGGQRQRIVLARALVRKPQFLLLDEATSALDTESERLIQETIDSLQGQVTVLIIAHRMSTIEHADRIIVLNHGKVVEEGSPQELMQRPESYFYKAKNRV